MTDDSSQEPELPAAPEASGRVAAAEEPAAEEPAAEEPAPAAATAPDTAGGGPGARRARLALLVALAALAALSYSWGISRDPVEGYYAAAVRSMAGSWHDFFYGSFDPAGTITLDKLPGAFWLQALSVRAFGYSAWAMILPQALEGVATVLLLYRAVARLAGSLAGLVAAFVLAASPAAVALDRGNISDSLMILLLVLAADALSGAIARAGHVRLRLLLAAVCVGLAFQAKMVEAWLVLPAFGLAYLVAGPGTLRRRVREAVAAGLVAGVVSIAWMSAVSLLPSSGRPYVDGSQNDSVYAQVFSYNGLGRFDEQTPLQALVNEITSSAGTTLPVTAAPPGPGRLLSGTLGRDCGWLLPAAAVTAVWALLSRRRGERRDPARACLIIWGGWLLTLWVAFSALTTINAYYTAALAPAVGAILGTGVALAWNAWREAAAAPVPAAPGRRLGLAAGVAAIVAGSAAYAAWLVPSAGVHLFGWLAPAVIAVGALSAVAALASVLLERRRSALFAGALFATGLGTGLIATALVPATASAGMAANHESAFDTPFESAGYAAYTEAVPESAAKLAPVIAQLRAVEGSAPDLLATQTAAIAAAFTGPGYEVLPIGGFTGSIPSPTLAQIQADVRDGSFHIVIALAGTTDPRFAWIAAHCRVLSAGAAASTYYCIPADAEG